MKHFGKNFILLNTKIGRASNAQGSCIEDKIEKKKHTRIDKMQVTCLNALKHSQGID